MCVCVCVSEPVASINHQKIKIRNSSFCISFRIRSTRESAMPNVTKVSPQVPDQVI